MSLAAQRFTHISADTYLASENDGPWRREFVNGVVYAMAGTSANHNLILGAIMVSVSQKAEPPCQTFVSDMKLKIKTNDQERYYYPDLFVDCDPNDQDPYFRNSPKLVVEVLSPTTERIDRLEKFEAYKLLPSLEEYVLVSQDAIALEVFRRRTGWQRESYVFDNVVTLESVGLSTSISTFFKRVQF